MHRLPKHEPIRVFEGFAGYGGATFGLRRAKINHKVAENGGYPPTQNGDTRSLFLLLSLPSPPLLTS